LKETGFFLLGIFTVWLLTLERVDVDPLESSVWGEEFAVVVTLNLDLPVVEWKSHGLRSDGGLSVVLVVFVGKVCPDPSWAGLSWSLVFSGHEFLTIFVIFSNSGATGVLKTPCNSFFVD
jgi:hypothetical protein